MISKDIAQAELHWSSFGRGLKNLYLVLNMQITDCVWSWWDYLKICKCKMVIENNRNASNEVHNFHGYYSINYFDSRTRYTIVSSCIDRVGATFINRCLNRDEILAIRKCLAWTTTHSNSVMACIGDWTDFYWNKKLYTASSLRSLFFLFHFSYIQN